MSRRQPHGNEFSLHSANHKPSRIPGLSASECVSCCVSRFWPRSFRCWSPPCSRAASILPGARPCIAIGAGSVQITSLPWQAQSHVSFTSDPALATVRVQIADNAEAADFAVIDDVDSAEAGGCEVNAATRFVAISRKPFGLRAGDLSLAGRPRRLPDLRRLEALYRARCRRPHRRRQRRAAPAGRGALNFLLTFRKPRSHRRATKPSGLKHFARSPPHRVGKQATRASRSRLKQRRAGHSGGDEAADFPDQARIRRFTRRHPVAHLHRPLLHDLLGRLRRRLWLHLRQPGRGFRLRSRTPLRSAPASCSRSPASRWRR